MIAAVADIPVTNMCRITSYNVCYTKLLRAKLAEEGLPLQRSIALITGAAGAIGAGICQELLENGCHVAATDLPGDRLTELVEELKRTYLDRIIGVSLDRITSYNVCYTKLLRRREAGSGWQLFDDDTLLRPPHHDGGALALFASQQPPGAQLADGAPDPPVDHPREFADAVFGAVPGLGKPS